MKKAVALLLCAIVFLTFTGAKMPTGSVGELNISKDNISYDISENLYGMALEDVNFAMDGGLVSNLVNNNSFEYGAKPYNAWNIEADGFLIEKKTGINENNPAYLRLDVDGTASIENIGYTEIYEYKTYDVDSDKLNSADMGFKEGETYEFSAYFKNVDFEGELIVSLKAEGNEKTYNFTIDDCEDWKKIVIQLESDVTADGSLLITANGHGRFLIDYVSLVPMSSHGYSSKKWKYASLRTDLYDAIKNYNPKFIRFPGDTFAGGTKLTRLYNWKDSIGPLVSRKQSQSPYAKNGNSRYYINTNTMGFYEYFLLCEDVNAIPIPVVHAAMTNQSSNGYEEKYKKYENGSMTEEEWNKYVSEIAFEPGTEEFDQYLQDILDLIEYANGDAKSEWGSKRAKDGHKDPFNLRYIVIGNENYGPVYWRNFDAVYTAVKETYPSITLIASAGSAEDFKEYDAHSDPSTKYKDVIFDEHYFTEDSSLYNMIDRYDKYERTGAGVTVGSYSATSDGYGTIETKSNIWSALEEAAFLSGIEKNADIVKMIAYAPTFAKVNAQSKSVNMIWFDSQDICLSPDYFVHMLYANNTGNKYISTKLGLEEKDIYESVTIDEKEQVIYVKLSNSSTSNTQITINLDGFKGVKKASVQYMSENFKYARNEIDEPIHVAPKESEISIKDNSFEFTVEGLSVNVIRIPYGKNDGSSLSKLPDFGIISPYMPVFIENIVPISMAALLLLTGVVILIVRVRHHKKSSEEKEE
ncbi:MAG: hypothetical protein K5761_00155 [Clostridiales bacterium]|nr:hypothetical protein [Clostridiales bacterium]